MAAVRSGGWTASGFAFAAAQGMMGDGTVAELSMLNASEHDFDSTE
jgi:hypothetical protein